MNLVLKTIFACKKLKLSFILLFLIPSISVGAIYKWVDEDGKTHYGSKRPETSQAEKLKIKVKEPVIPAKAKEDEKGSKKDGEKEGDKTKPAAKEPEAPKIAAKEKRRLCNQAKTDLQRIQARGRIRQKDADGNARYLTPQERGRLIQNAKNDIKQYCR